MKTFLKIALFFFLFINCESSEIVTGLEGTVYRSPIKPVEVEGQINYEPFSALFYVYGKQGELITQFHSDTQGKFNVFLVPGYYKIIPDQSAPIIQPQSQIKEVYVEPNKISSVDLNFDTGIR